MTTSSMTTSSAAQPLEIGIRQSTLQDLEALHSIINAAYRASEPGSWTTEAELVGGERVTRDELRGILETSADPIFVAEATTSVDKVVVGCIQAERMENQSEAMLGLFGVRAKYQSHGIGKRLMNHALAFVKTEWKCSKAVMWVIETRKELLAWYYKMGFKNTGEKRPFVLPHLAKQEFMFTVIAKEL
jgi:ribosomal protein S18 acetylase RimI-like enzyme